MINSNYITVYPVIINNIINVSDKKSLRGTGR